MTNSFDVAQRWPELFEHLDARQRRSVLDALAAGWHEGWVPNREAVAHLTDLARGAIDDDEYQRRIRRAAELRRAAGG